MGSEEGWVYVIHFEEPLQHAKHYVGSTDSLVRRLRQHARGHGAAITRHLFSLGLDWLLVAIYQCRDRRAAERLAKRRKNGPLLCPNCQEKVYMFEDCKPVQITYVTNKEILEWTNRTIFPPISAAKKLTDHTSESGLT